MSPRVPSWLEARDRKLGAAGGVMEARERASIGALERGSSSRRRGVEGRRRGAEAARPPVERLAVEQTCRRGACGCSDSGGEAAAGDARQGKMADCSESLRVPRGNRSPGPRGPPGPTSDSERLGVGRRSSRAVRVRKRARTGRGLRRAPW